MDFQLILNSCAFFCLSDKGLSEWQCWPEQQHHQHYPPEPQLNGDRLRQCLHETILSSVIKPEPDKFTAFLPLERPPGAATAKADAAVAVATDTLGGQDWDRVGFGWVFGDGCLSIFDPDLSIFTSCCGFYHCCDCYGCSCI